MDDTNGLTPDEVLLDAYKDRVAEVSLHGSKEGFLLTRMEEQLPRKSGHLWWKTSAESKYVLGIEVVWFDMPGRQGAYYDVADPASELLAEFKSGTFRLAGETYDLRWLDGDELARARELLAEI